MSKRHRRSAKLPPFVPLIKTTLATPAWKAMSYGARLVYISLRAQLRNDLSNNGTFFRSVRDIANDIGCNSLGSVTRWLQELEHFGFIVKTGDGFLGSDGHGIAARYRLTGFATPNGKAPTRDFDKWAGTPFTYVPPRPRSKRPKKQNPVPMGRTPRSDGENIRTARKPVSVCSDGENIDFAMRCSDGENACSLPSPSLGAESLAAAKSLDPSPADAEPSADAAFLAVWGTEQPEADAAAPSEPWTPYTERGLDERHSRKSLMAYVASVIEERLHHLSSGPSLRRARTHGGDPSHLKTCERIVHAAFAEFGA